MPNKKWEDKINKLFPPAAEHWRNEDPKWMVYEGICDCDSGFFCKHRQKYLVENVVRLLTQQKQELRERIEGMMVSSILDAPIELIGKNANKADGYNQALDDIMEMIGELE